MSPDEIRELRGELNRTQFAEKLGVTPLTVYRWELPVDREESRRPQKRMRRRLEDFQKPKLQSLVRPQSTQPKWTPLAPGEDVELISVFDDILNARWKKAEDALLVAMSSGTMSTQVGRIMVQAATALLKVTWRGDVRGGYAALAPVLAAIDTEPLSPAVMLRAHTAAALVFSGAEGRVFNAGRVNAHVVAAKRAITSQDHEFRALLRIAEMWAAFNMGDASLHERLRQRSRDEFKLAATSVVRWMAWEVGTLGAVMSGCIAEGQRFMAEMIDRAEEADLPMLAVRGSAILAYVGLFAAAHVDDVEALIKNAWEIANKHRIEPGFHTMLLSVAEAELQLRRARFGQAQVCVDKALEDARDIQWPPVEIFPTYTRLRYLTGGDLSELQSVFDEFPAKHRVQNIRMVQAAIRAVAAFNALDMNKAGIEFQRAGDLAREGGTMPEIEAYMYTLAYYAAVLSGDLAMADVGLRRAEQSLERLPFVWIQGVLRLYKAAHASLKARPDDAEQHSAAAEAAFNRAGDVVQLALARRLQAGVSFVAGDADAGVQMDVSAAHMRELGIEMPPPYQDDWFKAWRPRKPTQEHGKCAGAFAMTMPIDRISMRGLSPEQILDELFAILVEAPERVDPETTTLIQEVTPTRRQVLYQRGDSEVDFEQEFGDGFGRRFRVGVSDGRSHANLRSFVDVLGQVTSLAMEVASLRALTNPASAAVSDKVPELPGVIAASDSTREMIREIARLSQSRANVLIGGESGSGKEVVAHAVHQLSARSEREFVAFNCSAVPRDLFEGQLFGYRKGAFTGATSSHPGVIRAADGGTLFLDEVGDLPLEVQPKLLRFLENGEVFPLGETKAVIVNVRVVAATHRDLLAMVRAGTFREDLFYRLAVVTLDVLPLRERREDILALARAFIDRFVPEGESTPKLSPEAASKLLSHPWPGNVRELRNVIERSLAYSPLPEVLSVEHLRFA